MAVAQAGENCQMTSPLTTIHCSCTAEFSKGIMNMVIPLKGLKSGFEIATIWRAKQSREETL